MKIVHKTTRNYICFLATSTKCGKIIEQKGRLSTRWKDVTCKKCLEFKK